MTGAARQGNYNGKNNDIFTVQLTKPQFCGIIMTMTLHKPCLCQCFVMFFLTHQQSQISSRQTHEFDKSIIRLFPVFRPCGKINTRGEACDNTGDNWTNIRCWIYLVRRDTHRSWAGAVTKKVFTARDWPDDLYKLRLPKAPAHPCKRPIGRAYRHIAQMDIAGARLFIG